MKRKKTVKPLPLKETILEIAFIMFFFYANMIMAEFTQCGGGSSNGFWWTLQDVFTFNDFLIGLVCSFVGHVMFDHILKRNKK